MAGALSPVLPARPVPGGWSAGSAGAAPAGQRGQQPGGIRAGGRDGAGPDHAGPGARHPRPGRPAPAGPPAVRSCLLLGLGGAEGEQGSGPAAGNGPVLFRRLTTKVFLMEAEGERGIGRLLECPLVVYVPYHGMVTASTCRAECGAGPSGKPGPSKAAVCPSMQLAEDLRHGGALVAHRHPQRAEQGPCEVCACRAGS